jgi:hypothetical protein
MPAPVFKLPEAFVEANKAALEAWDWARKPEMSLATQFPDAGFASDDVLEALGRGSTLIVRAKHPGTMKRMRAYAETLAGHREPTEEEVAAALKARNPENR